MALTAVVGGPAIHGLGFGFVAMPVAVSSLLVTGGLAFPNGLTVRRRYPHVAPAPVARPPAIAIERADVEAALAELDEAPDIDVEDLGALVRATLVAAEARHHAPLGPMTPAIAPGLEPSR